MSMIDEWGYFRGGRYCLFFVFVFVFILFKKVMKENDVSSPFNNINVFKHSLYLIGRYLIQIRTHAWSYELGVYCITIIDICGIDMDNYILV